MILRPKTLITLLILTIILLAGCSGCAQKKITRETEIQAKKPVGLTSKQGVGPQRSDALPTTFYPPENPYEGITINGEAPPFEYYGNLVYWVPHMEYHNPLASDHTLPIIQEKYPTSHYRQVMQDLAEERGEALSAEEEEYIADKLYFGHLPPLDAAKCMLANGGSGSPYLLKIVQQALDENPNDFHTLLIWTEAQLQKSENREKGYRQLLQMRPNAARVLLMLGRTLVSNENSQTDIEEGIGYLKKSAALAPDLYGETAYHSLGRAYLKLKDATLALEAYNHTQQYRDSGDRQYVIERIEKGELP